MKLFALEQDVPRNLSEIYRALDLAQKRINALASSVKQAEGNLKLVQDMISLGSGTQLDFVNARNALFQTKLGMLTAFYQNSIALANLDLATGRYLRYVDSEPGKSKAARSRRKKSKWIGPVIVMLTLAVLATGGILLMLYINRESAEVVPALRGKAISAVYGTVKVEWAYVKSVKSEVTGYITFSDNIYSGVSSIGTVIKKDQLLATITDEATSKQIQLLRNNQQAALERQRMGPPDTQTLRNAKTISSGSFNSKA